MKDSKQESEVFLRLRQWADRHATVRAMLLTGSRANPNDSVDIFSDYDVVLVVQDIYPFFNDRSWLQDFGEVLVAYWDPIHPAFDYGIEKISNVIQYVEGLHIDFNVWPIELMVQITKTGKLPDSFDCGYTVLVDKDHLTDGLPQPTYQAYVPKLPTEEEYQKVIEDFFSIVPYVVKCLKRDELMPAKWGLDFDMKHNFLRQMLVWRMEIEHDWSESEGNLGKGLKKRLPSRIWSALEKTYATADIEENWEALFKTLSLFRDIGIEVAEHLEYTYPLELDQRVVDYSKEMKNIDMV